MGNKIQDKKIEKAIIKYYIELHNMLAYQSKLKYYNENKNKIRIDAEAEIAEIERKIAEIKFKNKHFEEIIDGLEDEEKTYVSLKYECKLSVTQIQDRMFIKERSYYRIRKKLLNYLSEVLCV
ncbi:DUF1492 domain-containing protein [Clostridium hydrogenum]|uniref:DUF1492 domain-containing protein n=1 Tax=Clostridium hydrogenum TaxID=2855764 RepID=UPI001F168F4B|nr:DUF1492 domain-containing protein [Clostridium hydrogenum]